jgi:threonine dehydrogenase-like Zn-dependent dehydrogenase
MRALVLVGEREIVVGEKPDPRPGPGEVVIQMRSTAICGSDLHPYRHPTPELLASNLTPGHEPAGVIVELGEGVTGWAIGDRVVVYFRRTCGQCHFCGIGHRNLCLNRRASYGHRGQDGSDAEYMAVETGSLMRLPDDFSFRDGTILSCQGGTAYAPLTRLGLSGRDTLAVSGLGPVGLLATLFGVALGARVVGIDPAPERRTLAEQLGAAATLDPTSGPVGEQIRAAIGEQADKLIETSGASAAHGAIGEVVKPRGMAAIVGLGTSTFTMPLMALVHRELTLIGSSIYPNAQFEEMCRVVRTKQIDLGRVVTHDLPLTDGPRAFQLADTATTGKVCFHFD